MKRIFIGVSAAVLVAATTSCEPDEISFVIKHVKSMPDAPACTYSISDDFISGMTVDLANAIGVENAYLVKNQLMSTEEYNNLDAESNGILLDYYDVSVTVSSTNSTIGSSRISYNQYIAPESEDLIMAQTLPASMIADLADELGCLEFNEGNYPADAMFSDPGNREDRNGNEVPRYLGTVYSTMRFFGHSQGGKDVSTQSFNFAMDLCCGCSINWNNCDSECSRYCKEAVKNAVCVSGVVSGGNLLDCRSAYYDLQATWDNPPCLVDPDNDSETDTRLCNCAQDCSTK